MPPQTSIEYEPAPEALIDALLHRIAADPCNVEIHKELRTAALKRKADGGPPPGRLARLRLLPRDPLQRLIHVERLSSLDPASLDWLFQVGQAIEACRPARPDVNFQPVRRWVYGLVQA